MALLEGKKALITGIANEKSIAYGIAKAFKEEGAELCITYANENLLKRVKSVAETLETDFLIKCDVTSDEDISNLKETINDRWGALDIIIHSIAYAPKEEFKNAYINTSREGFKIAMDVSVYCKGSP